MITAGVSVPVLCTWKRRERRENVTVSLSEINQFDLEKSLDLLTSCFNSKYVALFLNPALILNISKC